MRTVARYRLYLCPTDNEQMPCLLPGADIIAQRIERAVSQSSQETLDASVVEAIVDLSVERLGDTHLKVSLAALSTLLSSSPGEVRLRSHGRGGG